MSIVFAPALKKCQVTVWGSNCEPKFDLFSIIRMHESWDLGSLLSLHISGYFYLSINFLKCCNFPLLSILEGCGYSEAFCNKSSSLVANVVKHFWADIRAISMGFYAASVCHRLEAGSWFVILKLILAYLLFRFFFFLTLFRKVGEEWRFI